MTRRLLNLLTLLSLLLCVAVCVLWVRSCWYLEGYGIDLEIGWEQFATFEYSLMPPPLFDLSGVQVPYPVLVTITLALPTLRLILLLVNHEQQRLRTESGLCPTCGYDLRATPGRCPDCGHTPAGATA